MEGPYKKQDLPKETPKGRIVCAWCKKDMGPASTEMDTHGMCEECAKKWRTDKDPKK